jgi:hypothetical protein
LFPEPYWREEGEGGEVENFFNFLFALAIRFKQEGKTVAIWVNVLGSLVWPELERL